MSLPNTELHVSEEAASPTEQLLAELVGDFADRWRAGEEPAIESYLKRLPTDELRAEFLELIGIDRLLQIVEDVRADR
jgi:hypothetical protein